MYIFFLNLIVQIVLYFSINRSQVEQSSLYIYDFVIIFYKDIIITQQISY